MRGAGGQGGERRTCCNSCCLESDRGSAMGSSWTEGPQGGLVPPLVMPEHYPYKKVSISLNVREGGVTLGIEILPTYRFLQVRRREAGPDGRRGKDYLLVDDAGKEWPAIVALETSARTSHYVYQTHADFPHPEHRSGNFARAREYLRGVSPSRFRRSPTLTDPLTSSPPDSYPSPASLSLRSWSPAAALGSSSLRWSGVVPRPPPPR